MNHQFCTIAVVIVVASLYGEEDLQSCVLESKGAGNGSKFCRCPIDSIPGNSGIY